MKIAVIGSRGIPNQYGGFEELAEHLSIFLAKQGHDVYVYGHTMLNTPVLVRSLKLSNIGPS